MPDVLPTSLYYAEGDEAMVRASINSKYYPLQLPYHYRGGISTTLYVYPIIITSNIDMETRMRMTAPSGYVWEFEQDARYGSIPSEYNVHTIPGSHPIIDNTQRQLIWDEVLLTPHVAYGFTHRIRIPDNDPIDGLNNCVLEVGYYYNGDDYTLRIRHGVASMDAGSIRVINSMHIGYLTDLASYGRNTIDITFTLVTALPPGGGIIIRANDLAKGLVIDGSSTSDSFNEASTTCTPLDVTDHSTNTLPSTATCE